MLEELDGWHARYPALTELQRRTFAEKFPDAYRERLATSTKARGTLKNAMAWLRALHPAASRKVALDDAGLTPTILALFIEGTRSLVLAVETLDVGTNDDAAVQREAARETVNNLYGDTRERVNEAVGQNDTWRKQLDDALTSKRHDELDADAARLLRLTDALHGWLDDRDKGTEVIRASLSEEGVTRDTVARCTDAASALERARAKVTPKNGGRDTPLANRAEGAVLALMLEIFRKVNRARAKKATTLVLQPDAATRRILTPNAGRKGASKKTADDTDGASDTTTATVTRAKTKRRTR